MCAREMQARARKRERERGSTRETARGRVREPEGEGSKSDREQPRVPGAEDAKKAAAVTRVTAATQRASARACPRKARRSGVAAPTPPAACRLPRKEKTPVKGKSKHGGGFEPVFA